LTQRDEFFVLIQVVMLVKARAVVPKQARQWRAKEAAASQ